MTGQATDTGRRDEGWIRVRIPDGDDAAVERAIEVARVQGGILACAWDFTDPELSYGWIVVPIERTPMTMLAAVEAGLIPKPEDAHAIHAAPARAH